MESNITPQAIVILTLLAGHNTGQKSHHLIQEASAQTSVRLRPTQWMNILDALVQRGYLGVDHQRIELILTDRGRYFLEKPTELLVDIDQPAPILPPEILPQFDEVLYNRLRWKRRTVAEKEQIPVFRVFTNRSLAEMATYRPESLEEMRSLHGVGEHLSSKYGPAFLSTIQSYKRSVA